MKRDTYNPDVLNCLANLSNDEVFTPPSLANQVLDLLPQELFASPTTTFLDPVSKSGVFLREIVKRLDRGLETQMPDRQERIEHILHKQVFGIAITELTAHLARRSVYCSKNADSPFSVCRFDTVDGNIHYRPLRHTWTNGKCRYCGAPQEVYDRGDQAEQYAYEFIHTDKPHTLFNNMKFDVIIGNPPYQLSDGGAQASAMPIYHKFVMQAKKLNPRYLVMITPSRWFAGGRGLDDYRNEMLNDRRLRAICDYIDASECFPGVEIKGGISYFMWEKDYNGDCTVSTFSGGSVISQMKRPLLEKGSDVFIRYNEAISIFRKVRGKKEPTIDEQISSQKPFGLRTFFQGEKVKKDGWIKVYANHNVGYVSPDMISQNAFWIDKHKIILPRAIGSGDSKEDLVKPIYSEPGSCCTETYVVLGPYHNKNEIDNVMSYIGTKFFHFMLTLKKNTMMAPKTVYSFVPLQDFSHPWTDEMLYKKYGLSDEEIAFIESMIRPME